MSVVLSDQYFWSQGTRRYGTYTPHTILELQMECICSGLPNSLSFLAIMEWLWGNDISREEYRRCISRIVVDFEILVMSGGYYYTGAY
jgi:hypothetical protein